MEMFQNTYFELLPKDILNNIIYNPIEIHLFSELCEFIRNNKLFNRFNIEVYDVDGLFDTIYNENMYINGKDIIAFTNSMHNRLRRNKHDFNTLRYSNGGCGRMAIKYIKIIPIKIIPNKN